MEIFQSDRLYRPSDPEVSALLPYGTLAQYRHRGEGPEFVKLGKRVFYSGSALNQFIESKTVKTSKAVS